MAHERDYENMHDIEELDDRELRDLVLEQLSAHTGLDVDDLTVTVTGNRVTLSGRVGTEGEKRIAEHVLTDVLGIVDFTNELVVDQIRRAESPVAIDDHLADEDSRAGTLLGEVAVPLTDESEHLADAFHHDLEGTTDYEQVMEDGMTWNPPEIPTPEGLSGSDATPEDMGERH
jgi:BON domain